MAWFDGTFDFSANRLNKEFPVFVMNDLRLSEDRKRLAIINSFEDGSELFDLSDPHAEERVPGKHVFFHTFLGEDAGVAKRVIKEFLSNENDDESIVLLKKEPDQLFMYSFGHICTSILYNQEELRSLITETPLAGKDVFLLPLKMHMFKCPVCGHRTLQYRGYFYICVECGWEDEGTDDEDKESFFGVNGDYTIRKYREEYLQLKSEDPDYSWWKTI